MAFFALCCSGAFAGDNTVPGEIYIEPTTLHCLGFEWPITGDSNRNAAVDVRYRKVGARIWKQALPLLRIGGEKVGGIAGWPEYVCPDMFAGSIFELLPDTPYEVRLNLSDVDGGSSEKEVTVRTKAQPRLPGKGSKIHVYPSPYAGKKKSPAFSDLQAAMDVAEPGSHVLVYPGSYVGSYVVRHGGKADKPIVIRGAGGGETILINNKSPAMFEIHLADYLWFEDLTFRSPGTGDGGHTVDGVVILAGNNSHNYSPGCKGLVVRGCKFEDFGVGIMAADKACREITITDNYFLGRQDWLGPTESPSGDYTRHSYVAVWITGQGHDVAYNYVRGFRDGINVAGVGKADLGDPRQRNASIDFYNNDITEVGDDFIETDHGHHNIRILRNRCTNTQTCALSAQPVYGGPAYFIRNTIYNSRRGVALKFNVNPAGLMVYHNTFISAWVNMAIWSNGHFRNNLFVGPFSTGSHTLYTTMDYDGFLEKKIVWASPKWNLQPREFADLAAFTAEMGLEAHGIAVGYDMFENVQMPAGVARTYDPAGMDLRLKPAAAAIDAGCVLPNINDGHSGMWPDLGAFEAGQAAAPHYGPRPEKTGDQKAR